MNYMIFSHEPLLWFSASSSDEYVTQKNSYGKMLAHNKVATLVSRETSIHSIPVLSSFLGRGEFRTTETKAKILAVRDSPLLHRHLLGKWTPQLDFDVALDVSLKSKITHLESENELLRSQKVVEGQIISHAPVQLQSKVYFV